jgi:DNA modification methylase
MLARLPRRCNKLIQWMRPTAVSEPSSVKTNTAGGNRMLTLGGEKTALWKAWRRKDQTFYQCALECRAIGIHWSNIKSIITARRKAGDDITIQRWASQHAPVSIRWLNEYSEFANRWPEFLDTWRWSKSMPYSPERKAGLHTFQDLMLAKQRYDSVSSARQAAFGGRGERITDGGNSVPTTGFGTIESIEQLTPTVRRICGDVAEMLKRHVADGTADIAILDPPYWLSRYNTASGGDRCYHLAGMTPRFDADWDRFESIEHYEREAERWFMEVMRCLRPDGSAFICGSFHNIGLINRICQVHDFVIINEIIWAVRNSRPNASTMRLQASHHNVLWIAKEFGRYRYNYRACKQADYAGDYFSGRGRQMRSVWDILAAPRENKLYRHPSPKPVALFERMLDVAGVPGGLLLDLFSGSGTGAIAAMRWGMSSISIERDPSYCDMIRRRVADELKRMPAS